MVIMWQTVAETYSYGIAIHNYQEGKEYRLSLSVGEPVQILNENGQWYYGCTIKNRNDKGIFPKCYIHLLECMVDRSGPLPVIIPKQPPIVQEITSVLREWGLHWKYLYVSNSPDFDQIQKQIYELINLRSKILSGTLPVDEMKEIKKLVTSKIDMGNKILGLDLVVRDDQGNLLSPDKTSTVQLYFQHKLATERIKKAYSEQSPDNIKPVVQYSHIFFVSVRNFVCKMSEDAELLMTLYDAKERKSITENYVVRWSKDGLASDIDQMHNLRVLFTDLGSGDLLREKIYLVCYVIRIGAMESKEVDYRRSSVSQVNRKSAQEVRRPFGIAAMDVTPYLSGKVEHDDEQQNFVPFVHCQEKDNLDGTLRKLLNKELTKIEKSQGLWVSVKLLHGDIKQVREENPHLVLGNVAIARKMGFPEVILPGDVRNDLYLTLISGDFPKGNKASDKNVEVTVTVCNERGESIPGVMTLGGGSEPLNEYHSVIYYHECNPTWHETFKVAVPIEEFKNCHLKFTFKHRSSNEAKDKSEKFFAMSYVRLMQENGTTLEDTEHNLLVYKVDHKKFVENSIEYYKVPSTLSEVKDDQKLQVPGLILSRKENFRISTNICSTKLTQNVDLLGLLNWVTHKDTLEESLLALMKVNGEEVVKFLQDVLDALFNILMHNSDSDQYDTLVFNCLLFVITLVSDRKYQHFQPVLDLYIKESFSATLAYNKLIVVLKNLIDNAANINVETKENFVYKAMKHLQYCIRFIVRSRILFCEMHDVKDQYEFENNFRQLLNSIVTMMCDVKACTLIVQGACLRFLPSTIPDILKVFDGKKLSNILVELLLKIPENRLTKQKMMTINDIIHSQLFLYPECRQILLPVITKLVKELFVISEEVGSGRPEHRNKMGSVAKVAKLLGASEHRLNQHRGYSEEMELCVKILSDILNLTFRNDVGSTINDISDIMFTDLRTVIQTIIGMDRENPLVGNMVAVMIAIFRQMTQYHYELYIKSFNTRTDVLDFLMEILLVFKDLVNRSVFPADWCDMIMLQNSVILKCLRFFSHTIRDYFSEKFDNQAWSNFFYCAIAFMIQPALQLENFSNNKRQRIIQKYKDMRRETGFEIRAMWFNLGQHKVHFVPGLVGSILEMTLIPEIELRKGTIPIFFDMMQCEFYTSKFAVESYGDTKRDSKHNKGNFSDFENEMVAKLDTLIEGGKGDWQYKNLFHDIMYDLCNNHLTLREQGVKFVKIVTRLIERLLEYRCIINDDNHENRMSCTVNLLDFYSEINRKEMYIRYVNKLCDLHLECENFTEAAYTLKLHSDLLNWSDAPLPLLLKSNRYTYCQTHRELKESLYTDIIDYFDKGKMWECALQICQELVEQYKDETFDYESLSELHRKMAAFYDSILKQIRPEPEYFRVGYYGKGFPAFLQNKVYIHRGKEYERLSDFCTRTLNELPHAELLSKLTPPDEDITESQNQYVQINKVDPVMDNQNKRFSGKPISEQILRYYKVNDVQKFQFSRPIIKKEPGAESDNDFASLWLERTILITTYPLPGILRWFPIKYSNTFEISPLQNAIETMEAANKSLKDLVLAFYRDRSLPLNSLSLKLNGIVDPAVMGGIVNYEKAFFNCDYLKNHADDEILVKKLKDLIADQIPLLERGIQIHKERVPPSLLAFQQRLEECFSDMQASVVEKYGKKTCNLKFDSPNTVTMRRQTSIPNDKMSDIPSDVGTRSRVSSLTKSQVHTLKSLTSSFNFSSASSPSFTSKSSMNSTKHTSLNSPFNNKLATPSPSNKIKFNKTPKEKRRSKVDKDSGTQTIITSGTQWYTSETDIISPNGSVGSPVIELRQEVFFKTLTPKRPLRSEVEREKRLSRPPSGQFPNSRPPSAIVQIRGNDSSGNSSNRDSVGTTDSTASEEDCIPPPLPLKSREADYCNILEPMENTSFLYSHRASFKIPNKPLPPEPTEEVTLPPTPPPKPKKPQQNS